MITIQHHRQLWVTDMGAFRLAYNEQEQPVCKHCDAMEHVLVELTGPQIATTIMKRVRKRLHRETKTKDSKRAHD